ncbi:MAG: penicillin acylase family protein, partial [Chloroflexota bacterium]
MFNRFASQLSKPVIQYMSRNRLPDRNSRQKISGLKETVQIDYDKWGIPNIYAQNRDDLFFAQGFVHAQDRLWQMELNRLIAKGELASVLGKTALPLDQMIRTLGFNRLVEPTHAQLPEDIRATINAYVSGVNAFLQRKNELPVEFSVLRHAPTLWDAADVIAFGRLQGWTLSSGWAHQLTRTRLLQFLGEELFSEIDPAYNPQNPTTLPNGIESGSPLNETDLESSLKSTIADQLMPGKGGADGA